MIVTTSQRWLSSPLQAASRDSRKDPAAGGGFAFDGAQAVKRTVITTNLAILPQRMGISAVRYSQRKGQWQDASNK